LGSKYQQLTHLKSFYSECKKQNINTVLHAGDLTEGLGRRQSQIQEMFLHGKTELVDYIADNYPKMPNIQTFYIIGNHDTWVNEDGFDLAVELSYRREDLVYLGNNNGKININNCIFQLWHGSSGTGDPIDRLYRVKNKARRMRESGLPMPNVFIAGHIHCMEYGMDVIQNMALIQAGCFQSATPYEKSKMLQPMLGGTILCVQMNKNNIKSVSFEPILYDPIENDY